MWVHEKTVEAFDIEMGVKTLYQQYNHMLEDTIRKFNIQQCINVRSIQICACADDVALIARNRQSLTQVGT